MTALRRRMRRHSHFLVQATGNVLVFPWGGAVTSVGGMTDGEDVLRELSPMAPFASLLKSFAFAGYFRKARLSRPEASLNGSLKDTIQKKLVIGFRDLRVIPRLL